jgi:hypothetical protein
LRGKVDRGRLVDRGGDRLWVIVQSSRHGGFTGRLANHPALADGVERPPGESSPVVLFRAVSPGYLEVMGIPLLHGRGLTPYDGREEGARAVVVNDSFVRSHLEGTADPIGRRIRQAGRQNPWMTIVGVTPDVSHYGLDQETRPGIYEPMRQLPMNFLRAALRTTGDPMEITAHARRVTAGIDPVLPLYETETMAALVDESLWTRTATAIFVMLEAYPLVWLTALVGTLCVILFFVTSSDSASLVAGIIASGGNPSPPRTTRIF